MSRRGQFNGTVWFDCPFCGKRTGKTNLMGFVEIPKGFPEELPRYKRTPHTVKCWNEIQGS